VRKVFIAIGIPVLASAAAPVPARDSPDLSMRLEAILGDFRNRKPFPAQAQRPALRISRMTAP
jgi:hypothetical protein